MGGRNPFGDHLRALRHEAQRSMGQIARAIDVSVVYFSDVENGRRPPFAYDPIRYKTLAEALNTDVKDLVSRAEEVRKLEIDLSKMRKEDAQVTLALARKLKDRGFSQEELDRLRKLLNGESES